MSKLESSSVSTRNKSKERLKEGDKEYLQAFKEEIFEYLNKRLSSIEGKLQTIQKTNSDIEKSLEFISKQYEDVNKKVDMLEKECTQNRNYITKLEESLEELDRKYRRTSIEIRNLPARDKENKSDIIHSFTNFTRNSLKINMHENDIRDAYRISSKKSNNQPIVIELNSMENKNLLLKTIKSYNKTNIQNKINASHFGRIENVPIYISELLTNKSKKLFYLARELSKEKQYKYCWSTNGKIFVHKAEGTPAIWLKNEEGINTMRGEK